MSSRSLTLAFIVSFLSLIATARAQSPSAIYTWDNSGNPSPNIEQWFKNFGTATATLNGETSSTYQATGHFSDLLLRPVKIVPDPLHGPEDVLVLL